MSWNESYIKKLAADGKIKGYNATQNNRNNIPQKAAKNIPDQNKYQSNALTWLRWNLWYWARKKFI